MNKTGNIVNLADERAALEAERFQEFAFSLPKTGRARKLKALMKKYGGKYGDNGMGKIWGECKVPRVDVPKFLKDAECFDCWWKGWRPRAEDGRRALRRSREAPDASKEENR